jgi:hypothetical protein
MTKEYEVSEEEAKILREIIDRHEISTFPVGKGKVQVTLTDRGERQALQELRRRLK